MVTTARAAGSVPIALDRILWQRIDVDDQGPCGSTVAGIRRRRPASVRVGAHTARTLADSGVPTVTRRVGNES